MGSIGGVVLLAAGILGLNALLAPSLLAKTRKVASPSPAPSASPAAASSPASASSESPAASATPAVLTSFAGASATPAPSPATSPEPAFIQAYEAAYTQFLQEKYEEAGQLLDKADSVQPGQPSSLSLRNQMFKHFYGEAYMRYASKDYEGAVKQLDAADKVLPNQADSNNMRGLIFSRQKDYPSAEAMFKKSIAQDPTFWEAKFNLAELPFLYKNWAEARSRFEVLFGETDPHKLPKEAELTEFKVFLTLLMEGKEPAARSFMGRFTFSGATPARYYCQAALDFIHGDTNKALGWISSARKEYPSKLEAIFAQSFFRIGWLTDANTAQLAGVIPTPAPSPALTLAMDTPRATVPLFVPTPSPAPKPLDVFTPGGTTMVSSAGSPAPSMVATPADVASGKTAVPATPSPDLLTVPVPAPAAIAPPVAAEVPAPTPVKVETKAPVAAATATPVMPKTTPTSAPVKAAKEDGGFSASDFVAIGLLAIVLGQTLFTVMIVLRAIQEKQARRNKKPLRYSGPTTVIPQEARIP